MLASQTPTWAVRGGGKREFGFHKQCATEFLQKEAIAAGSMPNGPVLYYLSRERIGLGCKFRFLNKVDNTLSIP
jgi:hypothetical protein